MLLLAILTGFPRLSVGLFGAITQQDPAAASARDFFANVASHSEKGLEAARLQDCLNPLLDAALPDSVEPFMRRAPRVARFSFYTAKVAELKIQTPVCPPGDNFDPHVPSECENDPTVPNQVLVGTDCSCPS